MTTPHSPSSPAPPTTTTTGAGAATMMAQAVEAGARVLAERILNKRRDHGYRHVAESFASLPLTARDSWRADASAVVEAVLPLLLAAVVKEAATGPHNAGRVWFTREASGLNVALSPSEVLAALQSAATRVLAAQPQQQGKKEGEG